MEALKIRGSLKFFVATCVIAALLVGCNFGNVTTPDEIATPTPYTPPVADRDRISELVAGNTDFAFDLYRQFESRSGNLVYSPYSISLAFAMATAGATGETEIQLNKALRTPFSGIALHEAFGALDHAISGRIGTQEDPDREFKLDVANSLWVQENYGLVGEFVDNLVRYYNASPIEVDFVNNVEGSRRAINSWVAGKTNNLIRELISPGAINSLTRIVLVNAIYFKAAWAVPFEAEATKLEEFHLLDGSEILSETMQAIDRFQCVHGDGYDAIRLPYRSGLQHMLAIIPERGRFAEMEPTFSRGLIVEVGQGLEECFVDLRFPRFDFESTFRLRDAVSELGARNAFHRGLAEFEAINNESCLSNDPDCFYISDAIHKAVIEVDEEGAEAAAATAVIMAVPVSSASPPPIRPYLFRVDRPFMFLIRDNVTGSILFAGRVTDPR